MRTRPSCRPGESVQTQLLAAHPEQPTRQKAEPPSPPSVFVTSWTTSTCRSRSTAHTSASTKPCTPPQPSRCSPAVTYASSSARPASKLAADSPPLTAPHRRQAAGTGSSWRSPTSTRSPTCCAAPRSASGPTSSTAWAGRQILIEDPSGNPIELFQPTRPGGFAQSTLAIASRPQPNVPTGGERYGGSSCAGRVRDGAATQLSTDAIGRDVDASSSPIDG